MGDLHQVVVEDDHYRHPVEAVGAVDHLVVEGDLQGGHHHHHRRLVVVEEMGLLRPVEEGGLQWRRWIIII